LVFLSPSKTLDALEPYFRFKLFASSKFNATKFEDDKQSLVTYYNTLGYRDAAVISRHRLPGQERQHQRRHQALKKDIGIISAISSGRATPSTPASSSRVPWLSRKATYTTWPCSRHALAASSILKAVKM
jgi:hypothetical protein